MMGRAKVTAPQVPTKQPAESRVYQFDFADYPEIAENSETLTGTPTVTASPSGLTIGAPTISGTKVRFRVSAGTIASEGIDQYYLFECAVATSGSNTLEQDGVLILSDGKKPPTN